MKYLRFIIAFLVFLDTSQAIVFFSRYKLAHAATTYYASQTGSGSTCSSGSPCTVATGLSTVVAGDTLILKCTVASPQTYTGAASMLALPSGKSGTSTSRITVSAEEDGACLIDGQNARIPIDFNSSDYWTIEGFNAANSDEDVVNVGSGSDNNIIRRVVAWNANPNGNYMVFSVSAITTNTGNLLEDVAGFGTGRKIFQFYNNTGSILRRAWARHEYHLAVGPRMPFSITYNSEDHIFENVIGTWDQAVGTLVNQHYALLGMDRLDAGAVSPDWCANSKYLGSVGYLQNGSILDSLHGGAFLPNSVDCFTFKDVVIYQDSSFSFKPFDIRQFNRSPSYGDRRLENTSEIGGGASEFDGGTSGGTGVTITNRVDVANVSALNAAGANPFQSTAGTGARVCFRYVNGVLTSTPLWPWPMNQRIIDAMTAAGKTPVDVTATMESIFGAIPAACRTGSPTVTATYTALELGAETIPTAWDSAAFQNANVVNYQGAETGGTVCGGTLIHKMLWWTDVVSRVGHSLNCFDQNVVTVTTLEDTAGLVTTPEDKFDFRWKDDTSTACDAQTLHIVANLHPTFTDRDCNGGSFSTTTDLNVTVVKNIVSGTSWNMFIAHNGGYAIVPGAAVNAQMSLIDRDSTTAIRYFNSDSVTDLTKWGQITFSATTVPPSSGATHTITQETFVFYELRQIAGVWTAVRKVADPLNLPIQVVKGGKFAIGTQLDFEAADPPSLSLDLRWSATADGTYAGIPDTLGADKIAFFTASDGAIPAHGTAVPACLSGALTNVAGTVQRTSLPVTVDMAQDRCLPIIATIQIADSVAIGDTFCFRWANNPSGTPLNGHTNTPCITAIDYAAGGL